MGIGLYIQLIFMAMNQTKIVAIVAAVVIVLGAAVGVFMYMSGNGEDHDIEAALPVFGNADEDYKIDGKDLDVIQKIIDKESGYTLAEYPYADANYDKTVDSKDKDIVQKIINGKTVQIHHLSFYTGGSSVVDSKWPADGMIVQSNNVLMFSKLLGIDDKMVASTEDKNGDWYDRPLFEDTLKKVDYVQNDYYVGVNIDSFWRSRRTRACTPCSATNTVSGTWRTSRRPIVMSSV